MTPARRQLLVARIVAGVVPLRLPVDGRTRSFAIHPLSRAERLLAQQTYSDALAAGELAGLYTEAERLALLRRNGLWADADQSLFDALPREIEDFKVALYQAGFKSGERKAVRAALATARAKLAELFARRAGYSHLSAEGSAAAARDRFEVGCGLRTADGERVFGTPDAFWAGHSPLLDAAVAAAASERLTEADFRELCRTEPWRSCWAAGKAEGRAFGVPAVDLTDEQAALVGWSQLYDSVIGHPQRPNDEVLEDDDLLDGWLIVQRRAQQSGDRQRMADEAAATQEGKQEVFIVAETPDDARKVMGLNDQATQKTLRSRFAYLDKHGTVAEQDMPDTKRKLRMEMTQRMAAAVAQATGS